MILIRRAGILLPALTLFLVVRTAAQQPADTAGKLDTVMADTIVVGASTSPGFGSNVDTSTLAGTGDNVDEDSAVLRSVSDSAVAGWKKNRRFAYANDPAYWLRSQPKSNAAAGRLFQFLTSKGFRYFLYLLLAGVLIFVIIRVMSDNNFGVFYRRRIVTNTADGGAGEPAEEEDPEEGLRQALASGDHRRATRYLYLRTLLVLSQRGLIRLTPDATNHEYLRQLAGRSQQESFRFLTLAYEKVWYGDFLLGEPQFRRLHQHFVDFDKTVQP